MAAVFLLAPAEPPVRPRAPAAAQARREGSSFLGTPLRQRRRQSAAATAAVSAEHFKGGCRASRDGAAGGAGGGGPAVPREAHKIFDEAVISVRAGDGGAGEVVRTAKKNKQARWGERRWRN